MSSAVEVVKRQLEELEEKEKEFRSLGVEEESLKKKLGGLKAKLVDLKKKYDPIAGEYAEVILEATDIYEKRHSLARQIQEHSPREWIVPEYGYCGNLGQGDQGRVIHESACPATTGSELWELLKARRLKGKK